MNAKHVSKGVILVVDDNPENLGLLFNHLDDAGFTVLLVQDSESAIEQAEANQPGVILLDVMMPDMDGFDVCRLLKANEATKDIPVIFMTALTDTPNKIKGFTVGGVDYITKPFQYEEVEARVHAHLTIRRLQQELQEKNAQLAAANASKDRFFSIISHDLRSPFSGLLGTISLLAEKFDTYTSQQSKEMLMKLVESSEQFYALLENLLTWARIQRGALQQDPCQINLQAIVKHNISLLSSQAEQKQIVVTHAVQDRMEVYADMDMLNTVIRNLLSNALKFTHPGGTVTVSAVQNDHTVTVSVADTGVGIRPDHFSKLFRIDAKIKQRGTANEEGTGLGLILCKEFVRRNGGEIWVESAVGQGSTFRFSLPRPVAQPQ